MSSSSRLQSGLRKLEPGHNLFHDGETAKSLFIIQKGQLRLFKPKGRGFIEIAVLHAGEVIGEMAYFSEDGTGQRRSCSAEAMVTTEVIEISFLAFDKTMKGLNPWFKTIINTLASRLRKTNSRVKELESNSATVSYGSGKHKDYEFFKNSDIIKMLGILHLVFKGHGESLDGKISVSKKTLDLYVREIFSIGEAKIEEFCLVLNELGLFEMAEQEKDHSRNYICSNLDGLRSLFLFYNSEKYQAEENKLKISDNCLSFLEKINQVIPAPDNGNDQVLVPIDKILEDYNSQAIAIGIEDLNDAKLAGITGEVIVGEESALSVETQYSKLKKLLSVLRFKALIEKKNQAKA